jgi:acetylornithine deacetylase/succinyl-diaminopimelate desuccinylase-like protein
MTTPQDYAATHAAAFVDQLKEFLRIPSISTLSEHKGDVRLAAKWVHNHCLEIGMQRAKIFETEGHPIVYAEWLGAGEAAPTVLVYGHYDVQPVDDPRNEWLSPPFDPTERDGKLYGRGATDDKGQTFIHLKTFETFMQANGNFPVNVKFLIEGEEEMGSPNLEAFILDHLDLLACNVAVISDTHVHGEDKPTIIYGLRGMVYMEVEFIGPRSDLHSGAYGGAVHNPAQILVEVLAKLHDDEGVVTVPGFYEQVRALSEEERAAIAETPFTEERLKDETGVSQQWGDPNFTIQERLGARPTLEINGVVGGWTGEGAKTVIPSRALAKVSCRLVPDQDPTEIFNLIRAYIAELTPPTAQSEVRLLHKGGPAAIVPIDSPAMQVTVEAYTAVFRNKPVFMREGGSIPVVSVLQKELNIPMLLMGFGLPDDNLHAPNEKFTLAMFHKGIQTMQHFYAHLANGLA